MNRDLMKLLERTLRGELRKTQRRKSSAPWVVVILVISVFAISRWREEPNAPLPNKGTALACEISRVYDGDTVTARCENGLLKVRIYGIDAPEIGQKPWGEQSRDALRNLAPNGSSVRLQIQDTDRYGRAVAQLFAGDRDLGLEMVRQGRAVVYAQYNRFPAYKTAQSEAQHGKKGVWVKPGAQQTPWEWRKLNPR
ncbi:MAG: thermonuclease family protein [Gammaproteobacteria bacterium]|nr:thermonuclease family protein [Gammaproteobacteria bacterium]MCP5424415.1 thermonuclease family protein [Gammaproteobacteria bacterium]MCP5458409.1 thermonuclease family protein [Gammaproteobacteria bacterium]